MERDAIPVGITVAGAIGCGADHERNRTQKKKRNEPTSALDPTIVGEVQSVIRDLTHMDKTMMIVTHELNFARAICSRMSHGPGWDL